MKKATSALTSLAALTVTTVVTAQEPTVGGPPHPPQPAAPQPAPQAGQTTVTSADPTVTAPPPPMPPPAPPRDTITVRQSYRPHRPLLYTGSSMLISSYIMTATYTNLQNVRDSYGDQPTYVPVAGPWMHLANKSESMLDTVLLAGSGVAQGAGLVIAAVSFFVPERVPAATIEARGMKLDVTASSFGPGSAGIGAFGQF